MFELFQGKISSMEKELKWTEPVSTKYILSDNDDGRKSGKTLIWLLLEVDLKSRFESKWFICKIVSGGLFWKFGWES